MTEFFVIKFKFFLLNIVLCQPFSVICDIRVCKSHRYLDRNSSVHICFECPMLFYDAKPVTWSYLIYIKNRTIFWDHVKLARNKILSEYKCQRVDDKLCYSINSLKLMKIIKIIRLYACFTRITRTLHPRIFCK